MTNAIVQVGLFFIIVTLISVPLGLYMARVFSDEKTFLDPVLKPVEKLIYRVCGIHPATEMTWWEYAISMLLFSMVGMLLLYAIERLQQLLPFNPQAMGAVAPDLAFNTAASFTTNTNWQAYGGESTMSYFTQMAGLAFHNFVSAASGIAIAIAVIRGFVRKSAKTIGNFWFDLTRATLWVLLPISIVFALVLVWQGVPQNLSRLHSRARRWKAPNRSSRKDQSPRRRSSRSWAPMAAASSMPTRRIRMRIPPRSPICSR